MNTQIKNVIRHLESQRTAIESALLALKALDADQPTNVIAAVRTHNGTTRRRGALTAEGRRRISEAMKARWAAQRIATRRMARKAA